jgi:hypothetical protein
MNFSNSSSEEGKLRMQHAKWRAQRHTYIDVSLCCGHVTLCNLVKR